MSSNMLIDEPPLLVSPSLATAVGLNEAIFLQQVHYWLNPRFNKNKIDGRLWVHNTYEQWQQQFPFWSEKTIRRTIGNLETMNVLESYVSINGFKKTKYYTINYARLESLKACKIEGADSSGQNDQIDLPVWADACGQSDQMDLVNVTRSYNKDTETTTENTLPPLSPPSTAQNNFENDEDEKSKFILIWNEVVQVELGETMVSLTPRRAQLIPEVLENCFESNLELWRSYCRKIASCKFVMGENRSGFRVSFDWAINADNIAKILEEAIYDKPTTEGPVEFPLEKFKKYLNQTIKCEQWRRICLILAKSTSQATFKSWFEDIVPQNLKAEVAELVVSTKFRAEFISNNYSSILLEALRSEFPQIQSFKFILGGF